MQGHCVYAVSALIWRYLINWKWYTGLDWNLAGDRQYMLYSSGPCLHRHFQFLVLHFYSACQLTYIVLSEYVTMVNCRSLSNFAIHLLRKLPDWGWRDISNFERLSLGQIFTDWHVTYTVRKVLQSNLTCRYLWNIWIRLRRAIRKRHWFTPYHSLSVLAIHWVTIKPYKLED